MKKSKHYLSGIILILLLTFYQNSNAQSCYISAANNSQIVASGIHGPIETGCDMLKIDTTLQLAVYVWGGTNDVAKIAWQLNNGTIHDTTLQDPGGLTPDVALVSYNGTIYAVVAYQSTSGKPQWEAYKFDGSTLFHLSNSLYTDGGGGIRSAIHVDGDAQGYFTIAWDYSDPLLPEIYYISGDMDHGSPYTLIFDNTPTRLMSTPLYGNQLSFPDVGITTIDGDSTIICFSWRDVDNSVGISEYVEGACAILGEIYDTTSQRNINLLFGYTPSVQHTFFEYRSQNGGINIIGKTSISLTERHIFSIKHQPFIAWEEVDSLTHDHHIYAAANYWDGAFTTVATRITDMTDTFGTIYDDINYNPQVINAYNGNYMITGWNYEDNSMNCVDNNIEPLAVPLLYSGTYTPTVATRTSGYLGIGRPGQHGNNGNFPSDELKALSLAGKQSDDILYFFFDVDSGNLYSKKANASVTQLRLLQDLTLNENNQLFITPNPINELLFVNLPEGDKLYTCFIYDINGREIINIRGQSDELQSQLRMKSNSLSPGVYLVKMMGDKMQESQIISKF